MRLPNRNNPYSFDAFLEKRDSVDFYRDDPFFQRLVKHFTGPEWSDLHGKLLAFSPVVSDRWRRLSEQITRPSVHPQLLHYDAHNHRIDRIVRPMESHVLEKEIFSQGLFSSRVSEWESFTKRWLINQLGEFGVTCPMACTHGLIAILEHFPDPSQPALQQILHHCKEGIDGEFGIGAQFITEIQGGSDIPANLLEAVPEGDHYRLYGNKFFCSAVHADYSVVTAKITGSEEISVFVVPSWLPGDKEKERRNGYRINRLKWKMGTCELPTAEIQYEGAVAYPVGPKDRGLAAVVGIVLTLSRLSIGIASSAFMARVTREAKLYSEFREAFGKPIGQFPLAARQIRDLERTTQRTTAGAFQVYDQYIRLGKKHPIGLLSDESLEARKQQFRYRELVLLQKIVAAHETVDVARKAMSIFGGHGVMEDFSAIPRLLRDAMVNELWEGPKNVLLSQIYRDIQRVTKWYDPATFIADLLNGAEHDKVQTYTNTLTDLLQKPIFDTPTEEAMDAAEQWEKFCFDLFHEYQELALQRVMYESPALV
jgi:alkylation response protein AidB-like acyl-CoA dehydrogenase